MKRRKFLEKSFLTILFLFIPVQALAKLFPKVPEKFKYDDTHQVKNCFNHFAIVKSKSGNKYTGTYKNGVIATSDMLSKSDWSIIHKALAYTDKRLGQDWRITTGEWTVEFYGQYRSYKGHLLHHRSAHPFRILITAERGGL